MGLARVVAHGLNPAGLALAVFATWLAMHPAGWSEALLGLLFYALLPGIALLYMLFTGRISALYPEERLQRSGLLLIGLASYGMGYIAFYLVDAHVLIKATAMSFTLVTLIIWFVNKSWKISIHAAGVGGGIWLLLEIGGSAWWPGILALPLVAWSRLYLKAHTPLQIMAGFVVGGAVSLLACVVYIY